MNNPSKSNVTTTRSIALVAILTASTVLSGCTANTAPATPETYSASGSGGVLAQEHTSQGSGGALRQDHFPAEGVSVPPAAGSVNFPEEGSTVSGGALEGVTITEEVPSLWQADAAM